MKKSKESEHKCCMCDKKATHDDIYCYKHYQEYLDVKSQQCWSVEDDEPPF